MVDIGGFSCNIFIQYFKNIEGVLYKNVYWIFYTFFHIFKTSFLWNVYVRLEIDRLIWN